MKEYHHSESFCSIISERALITLRLYSLSVCATKVDQRYAKIDLSYVDMQIIGHNNISIEEMIRWLRRRMLKRWSLTVGALHFIACEWQWTAIQKDIWLITPRIHLIISNICGNVFTVISSRPPPAKDIWYLIDSVNLATNNCWKIAECLQVYNNILIIWYVLLFCHWLQLSQ